MVVADPTTKANPPRLHPVLIVAGELWRAAAEKKELLPAEEIDLTKIATYCERMRRKHRDYPLALTSMNLVELTLQCPLKERWWLPQSERSAEDNGA